MKKRYVFVAVVLVALIGFLVWSSRLNQPDSNILGTWVWQETQMNDGSVVAPNNPGIFSLTFDEEGQISGATDCNGFSGSYITGPDGTLSFGSFASTLMFCEGSQESVFTQMVTDSDGYLITEEGNLVLLIKFDSGSVIFTRQ